MPARNAKAVAEEAMVAAPMQRTTIIMFALVSGQSNTVSFPMAPLFITGNEFLPAADQGESDPPESAFHSDLFLPSEQNPEQEEQEQGGHFCKWQNGVQICPPH